MKAPEYIAVIHQEGKSDYGVSFPDFPGCITAGTSLSDALVMAEEALALHINGMLEDGDALPSPSDIATVQANPDYKDGAIIVVKAKVKKRHKVRINITADSVELEIVDQLAAAAGMTRSSYLFTAAMKANQHGLMPKAMALPEGRRKPRDSRLEQQRQ